MKIGALAPWFGCKRTLAPRIVEELGPHTQYFEPFLGSAAVLFAKEPSQKETVSDLHGDLTNLARVVSDPDAAPVLYEHLQQTVFSEAILQDARVQLEDDAVLPLIASEFAQSKGRVSWLMRKRAYWYFLACWMGRNGTAGTERVDYQIAVRWTKSGGSPTVRFRNAVESIPAWHRRLLNVVILQRDAFEILDRFEDDPATAIYCDPPYPAETRSNVRDDGTSNHGGSGQYLHEFKHGGGGLFGAEDDHARLARILRGYKRARIVVSTYDCPRYRELFDGWTFVDCKMLKLLHQQSGRGERSKEAPEVLIINGPSFTNTRAT
jgi:DNA adenine methylase